MKTLVFSLREQSNEEIKEKVISMFTNMKITPTHMTCKYLNLQNGGGGINWEIGINIYTLLYIK